MVRYVARTLPVVDSSVETSSTKTSILKSRREMVKRCVKKHTAISIGEVKRDRPKVAINSMHIPYITNL